MMKLKINIVDAFTDTQFRGNAAAVIITNEWLSDELMQSIAIENNLSETAFLIKIKSNEYQIRWFSLVTEINFCGHATLASSFVIFSDYPEMDSIILFAKEVGEMIITKAINGYIQMDFPKRKPTPVEKIPSDLINGLSIKPSDVLRNDQAYFAIYENENDIFNVRQNNKYLEKLAPYDVVVTAKSKEYDFVSRYFWPANGGDEDPVTGSIHTGLAPYWSDRLNKYQLVAYQASKRGGVLSCCVSEERVFISGKAVHYLEGVIHV